MPHRWHSMLPDGLQNDACVVSQQWLVVQ